MSNEAVSKTEILDAIERERAAWHALVEEVGEERMLEPGPMGEWTFKDLAAHLTGWREWRIIRLEAVARGAEPSPPWPANLDDVDAINVWIYEQHRQRPVNDVLADADVSFDRLREAVESLPSEALVDPKYFPWMEGVAVGPTIIDGSFFVHYYEEHEPTVRAWLNQADE